MVSPDVMATRKPEEVVHNFGVNLASGLVTERESLAMLEDTAMAVRCDSRIISPELALLDAAASNAIIFPMNPLFPDFVGAATRSIIYRNNDSDQPSTPDPHTQLKDLVDNSTEGILWESAEGKVYRERVSSEIGTLLRSLQHGLEAGGCHKKQAQFLIVNTIETDLDDVATRITSYAAMNHLNVSHMILKQAGLATPPVVYREVKRIGMGFWKSR